MTKKKQPSRLAKALLETADDMRRAGIIDAGAHEKITLRHLGSGASTVAEPITGDEIRLKIGRTDGTGRRKHSNHW